MGNSRIGDGFYYKPVNPVYQPTPAQINAAQEQARRDADTRAKFQAAQEEIARARAKATADRLEAERPQREAQQRRAAELRQEVEQRAAEYRSGVDRIKEQYKAQDANSREVYQALRNYREEERVNRTAPKLDLAPGRPPGESDYSSSTKLRNSTLPTPAPLPINPTKNGEMVHVPKSSLSPLPKSQGAPSPQRITAGDFFRRNYLNSADPGVTSPAQQAFMDIFRTLQYDYLDSRGVLGPTKRKPGDSIVEEAGRGIVDAFKNLSRSSAGDRLADLLNLFPNPYKKRPRTDPKNDDLRPPPQRFTYDWRGLKFYSPNNRRDVSISAPFGQYSLNDFGEFEGRPYAIITWDNLIADGKGGFYVQRGNTGCDPGTIEPDPTYIPPSYELPVLSQPDGTTPDVSNYPPIFTEDDFKPRREQNDEQARQDEQDRQNAPDPEQQRQDANEQNNQPDSDPWDKPFPTPDGTTPPQPFPFDPPSSDPDTTPNERLREKLDELKDRLSETFPPPVDEPRTETTINGKPVNSRRPVSDPTNAPGTNVTINGVPEPRLNPPLPDTRTQTPTKTKAPTETRIDPTTGLSPTQDPDPKPDTPTPEKCKDPCIQGLHDKQDAKASKPLKVKIFKACVKPVAEGQTVKPNEVDFEERTINVPSDELEAYRTLYDKLFALESAQCGDTNAIASVPEWWQARRGADIPQLAIVFAEQFSTGKLGDSRWTLCIPHYNRPKGAKPAIPAYNKGNWFGSLKLTDGSKLGVNAASSSECKRVLNRLKIHIPVQFRTKNGKAIKPRIVEDPSADFKECKVTPVRADYYSKGQANMKPDWSMNLRQK